MTMHLVCHICPLLPDTWLRPHSLVQKVNNKLEFTTSPSNRWCEFKKLENKKLHSDKNTVHTHHADYLYKQKHWCTSESIMAQWYG